MVGEGRGALGRNEGRLGVPALRTGYQERGKLPADAAATGFVNGCD